MPLLLHHIDCGHHKLLLDLVNLRLDSVLVSFLLLLSHLGAGLLRSNHLRRTLHSHPSKTLSGLP